MMLIEYRMIRTSLEFNKANDVAADIPRLDTSHHGTT